ncbi:uncharacterized protein LOC127373679 [Dicentrarchus labrax]|uniref:Chemokine interleukin-8-like domain-containing protein n=1 Tax=Dicentrarchus labrax TaxID=13489 RepID=A0A8C4GVY2_DICLA|nr:uncharacterized protein LOC127373679 [Dicentrarchus labrax]
MPFSARYELTLLCLTMPLLLFAQVDTQCNRPHQRTTGHVNLPCCLETQNGTIKESVNACYIQNENTFSNCKIHAYIFTKAHKAWCVDPTSSWLPGRLQRLQRRGIFCCTL